MGALIAAVGLGCLAYGDPGSHGGWLGLTALVVFPAGIALAFSGGTVSMMASFETDMSALAGGLLNTVMEVGPTVGLAALVSLAAARTSASHLSGPHGQALGYQSAVIAAALVFGCLALGAETLERRATTHAS